MRRLNERKSCITWILAVFMLLIFSGTGVAANLELARVEYRDYNDTAESHTRIAVMFTDDSGNYIDPTINNVEVTYQGSAIELLSYWSGSYWALYGSYDESAGRWQFADSLVQEIYNRVKIAPSTDFSSPAAPSGTYNLTIQTNEGTFTRALSFTGEEDLPRIDATTFAFTYNTSGDLTITWTLPDQNEFPQGASLSLTVEDGNDWTMAGYFSMPTTVSTITIPHAALVSMGSPTAYNVVMRTASQDGSNRAYSDTVFVQADAIQVVDDAAATEIDGGYTVGSSLWLKAILQVIDSPVTLVWKEVGTDDTPSGARVISGYFYADPDDFAYGSLYNPEVFVKIYIDPSGWCNIAFNHVTVDAVSVESAHSYNGAADQTGQVTLSNRLAEHTFNGVQIEP